MIYNFYFFQSSILRNHCMGKRTALITGGSRGIGKAIATIMSKQNIAVLTPTRQEMDLLKPDSIDQYCKGVTKKVDIIINNAGINPINDILQVNTNTMHEVLQVNLLAPINIIKYFLPGMIERKFGRIVNISSIWSTVSKKGRCAYSVSKSGLDAYTRSLAIEMSQHNILTNSIAPGFVKTELTTQNNTPAQIAEIAGMLPIKRFAEPEEIAEIVYFLSSENNSFITGQTIIADGGYTCL